MRDVRGTDAPWKVGVLFSNSGYMAIIERTQLQGTLTAIEEINAAGGIGGRPLQPVIHDPASEPAGFARCARRMMMQDQVQSIFGCYTSSSRKAVLPVVERLNGLLWYPTVYEGFEFSPNVIYTGAAPNQTSVVLCQYLMPRFGTRFFFIGSDYVYPRESNRIMRELVIENGGSVVGERYVPLWAGRRDFKAVMAEIRHASPDVIFSTVVGDSTTYLYQSYAELGLDPAVMPIASLTTTEAEIAAMGPDVGAGHITAAPYFASLRSEANDSFVSRMQARHGSDVNCNMCFEAAYFQVHMFARALAEANSTDTEALRPLVMRTAFEAPQGRVAVNPVTGHTDLWARIGRANRLGQFDVLFQSHGALRADPYMVGAGRKLMEGLA